MKAKPTTYSFGEKIFLIIFPILFIGSAGLLAHLSVQKIQTQAALKAQTSALANCTGTTNDSVKPKD